MKRTLVVLAIVILAIGAMGFGRFMIGGVEDNTTYTSIAIGTDLGPNMFVYGGLGFWWAGLSVTGGTGLILGDLYSQDFGTLPDGKEIGAMKINYGALGAANMGLGAYSSYISAFVGPAAFFDFNMPLYSSNFFMFLSIGLSIGFGSESGMGLGSSFGGFYVF